MTEKVKQSATAGSDEIDIGRLVERWLKRAGGY